jgi:molybdopterin/thiamine biosynthesis adenylyltransferase
MRAGEKGISGIVAIGICIALALTAAGVGAVAVTGGVIVDGERVEITSAQVHDYIDENGITIDEMYNMTWHEKMSLCVDVARANM